ncbi:MAG: ABC transporter substrate-binding protein [Acidimicrobiales bacterium]|nr:ABC transporter substrate-binding protein [Acidimicrobiales bacterium]
MTTRTRWARWSALALALVLTAAACGGGGREDSGGDSGGSDGTTASGEEAGPLTIDTSNCTTSPTEVAPEGEVTFGTSVPQSGLFAAFSKIAEGYNAYFDYLNSEEGGVDGREVTVEVTDDGYESGQTVSNVQQLIQQDQVFGIFNVVGTPNNLAIRDTLNQDCVPQLYAATGAALWGNPDEYPFTIGSLPTYATEMGVFVDYLEAENPDAKVAILFQNDDFGEEYVNSFETLTEGTDITVVTEESYEPSDSDVDSQVTSIANSGADTVVLAATALKCPQALDALQAQSGFDPETVWLSQTCTSSTVIGLASPGAADGVLSAIYLKDPADPQWDDDPAMVEFQEQGQAHGLSAEQVEDGVVGIGWTFGQLLAETIRNTPELTRENIMQSAYSLDGVEVGLLLPGVSFTTNGAEDPFPIETLQIGQYNGEFFDFVGDPIDLEGQSAEFTPQG